MCEEHRYQRITFLVNKATGEVVDEIREMCEVPTTQEEFDYIDWVDSQREARERGDNSLDEYYRKKEQEDREERIKKEAGPFVWVKFAWEKPLFPEVDSATLARALYVGCHRNFPGSYEPEKMGLKSRLPEANAKMLESGLFKGKVAPDAIVRGLIWCGKLKHVDSDCVGKLFTNSYKWAIAYTTPRQHAMIGDVLRLLPYTHQVTNVICREPTNDGCVHPMDSKEITALLGKSAAHSARTMESMMELKFEKNGRRLPIFYQSMYAGEKVYCIHPEFWYASDLLARNDLCVPTWY